MTAQSDREELKGIVETEVARSRVPGFAVGLLQDDEEFSAGFGITNLASGRRHAVPDRF
ncbi:MAG: hypothetical protein JO057_05260, partial [Chloroflexi bacterium]|nr:hypothetical protein [Chloroflexota bacterium]